MTETPVSTTDIDGYLKAAHNELGLWRTRTGGALGPISARDYLRAMGYSPEVVRAVIAVAQVEGRLGH